MRFGSFLMCAALAPLLTAASQPVRLQPSSQWIVDYAVNSCRLVRSFGEGKSKTFLLIESESPGSMDMVLIGKPLDSEQDEISAKFLPYQKPVSKGHPVKSTSKGEPGILFSTIQLLPEDEAAKAEAKLADREAKPNVRPPASDLADELNQRAKRQQFADTATELEVDPRPGRQVILETGSLGAPIKAFDQCTRDSLKDWGVDPELEDKIVKSVWLENVGHLIRPEEYPTKMLDEGQQSDVKVRVLVDSAGHVTKCTSLSHFKLPQFNQLVCEKITSRAKFAPAELADGTKVPSYYTVHIVFRIDQ